MAEKGVLDDTSSSDDESETESTVNGEAEPHSTISTWEAMPVPETKSRSKKTEIEKDFSHPVYKNISHFNGQVNKMKRNEIINRLKKYSMDTNGTTEILKRRLKNCYKRRRLTEADVSENNKPKLDYIVVIDYEATCEADVLNYRHEIIEFPAVLVNVSDGSFVDEFRHYCKPIENPELTKFCTELTGITQDKVDAAEQFSDVLQKFETWLQLHRLGGKRGFKFAVATDGPWDMRRFLYYQCKMLELEFPKWAKKWVNLRKMFANFYKRERGNIQNMLCHLGLKFEGRQHCGMDDTRNIARIAQRLMKDGCFIDVNEGFSGNDRGRVQEIKPDKKEIYISEPKLINIKTEADKKKDQEVREALRKLQIKEDEALFAIYKSKKRY